MTRRPNPIGSFYSGWAPTLIPLFRVSARVQNILAGPREWPPQAMVVDGPARF